MSPKTLLSIDDFAAMPRDEAVHFELIQGELVPVPSGTPKHCWVRDSLGRRLMEYLKNNPLGVVLAEMDCRTAEGTVRRPDLSYLTAERWRQIDMDRTPVPAAPDIAIEVLSPTEIAQLVNQKVAEYLAYGSREVWLLDAANLEIHICGPTEIRRLLAHQSLQSPLLPGFSAPVKEVLSTP